MPVSPIIQPRRGIIKPTGRPEIDWDHPIAQGLSSLYVFDALGGPLYIDNGGGPTGLIPAANTGDIGACPLGSGLTGSSVTAGFGTNSNLYQVPKVGSAFVYTTATWSPADGLAHEAFEIGLPTAPTLIIDLVKHTDNNWYFGWLATGNDSRAVVAASGTFNAGDSFLVGGTWNTASTKLYCKGSLIKTNAVVPAFGATNTGIFYIGNQNGQTGAFSRTRGKDAIYLFATWSRELSAGEIAHLNKNPYSFLIYPEDDLFNSMIKGIFVAPPAALAGSFNRQFPTPNFRAYPVESARSFPRY